MRLRGWIVLGILLAWSVAGAKADITITPATLPNGVVGTAYSATLTGDGCSGACVWSSRGTLPPGLSLGSASGTISGTPASVGSFPFTITATDKKSNNASQSYNIDIAASTLTINTSSSLPDGKVGTPYSQTLGVSGGTGPYSWSVTGGGLPSGLSLNASSGALAGTPSSAGTFNFTIQVKDANNATATRAFTVTMASSASKLTITTSSLPAGTVGAGYSQTVTATGGTLPYSWALTSGTLPDGLRLDSGSGAITGTPSKTGTFSFTVRVTDKSSGVADQSLQISVGSAAPPPATPTLSFSGLPTTTGSAIQMSLRLVLSSASTQLITGQVALTFQPDAAVARDDPSIQFSTGSRTAPFTIPAGATTAVFSSGALALQTGTVAGTLTFTVNSNLPGSNPTQTIVVPRAGPILAGASVVKSSSGFQVQVTGFSNTRELTGAIFHFTAAAGQTVQTSDLSVSLASVASQWYTGSTSTQFGGQFLLVVPFSVTQGAASGLSSVSVQLQNGQGPSAGITANF